MSCEYGSGVSGFGTDGYAPVQITFIDGFNLIQSDGVRYFNYSYPSITGVSGCTATNNSKQIIDCSRQGGIGEWVTISGKNFGSSGARAFISGYQCTETRHDPENKHTKLFCAYPAGTRTNEDVWVLNSRGGTTPANEFGQLSYYQCPKGQFQTGTDNLDCQNCAKGHFSDTLNAEFCEACEQGTYSNSTGSDTCFYCQPGTFASTTGSVNCTECSAGTYSSATRSSTCSECDKGTFANGTKNTECQDCEPGTAALLTGRATCHPCDPGSSASASRSESCSQCPAGQYASGLQNTECTDCPRGYISQNAGSSSCSICPRGTYSLAGWSECTPCDTTAINPIRGSDQCWACDESSNPSNHFCDCDAGFYKWSDTITNHTLVRFVDLVETEIQVEIPLAKCRQCTVGMECGTSGLNWTQIYPQKGYMPMIHTTPETLEMMECVNQACVGGSKMCETGFTGPLCTQCEQGLGEGSGFGCNRCPPIGLNVMRMAGTTLAVTIIICAFIRQTIKSAEAPQSEFSTIGKIFFSYVQFNSIALQFDYSFPPIVDSMLEVQEAPAHIGDSLLSIDCFIQESPTLSQTPTLYLKAVCYLIIPWVIFLLARVVFCKYSCHKKRHEIDPEHICDLQADTDPRWKLSFKNLINLQNENLPPNSRAYMYVNAWNSYITAVIVAVFMIHPSIVQTTFAMFNCIKLGALDTDWYLLADMSAQCYSSTHFSWLFFVGAPMCIFYVFGMPLFVLYRLYLNREELRKPFDQINRNVLKTYHFLFKGYEGEFFFWEIVIMIRKILIIGIAVFFSYDTQIQSLLAILLVVIALSVHAYACPFVSDTMDGLELLSLFGSFITYFMGQFLFLSANIGPVCTCTHSSSWK